MDVIRGFLLWFNVVAVAVHLATGHPGYAAFNALCAGLMIWFSDKT